jgi:hypothetical protein
LGASPSKEPSLADYGIHIDSYSFICLSFEARCDIFLP